MAGTAAACLTPLGATPAGGAVCLAAGLLAYAAVLLPLSGREPLRGYRDQFVAAALRRLRPAPAPARND